MNDRLQGWLTEKALNGTAAIGPTGKVPESFWSNIQRSGTMKGWGQICSRVKQVDEKMVSATKEDMDNLLVFTGLFSAVLTALNIESYKDLKQDPADVTATLLVLVAQSVNSFVIKDNMINSTFSLPLTPEPFEPSRASVVINALWFTSLVLSLTTASFAILVKQWLKEFPPSDWMSPREHLEERLRRYDGFMKWHVLDIANALPLVLQLSLALFFVGLGEFLRQLHPFIGWWISALTYIWFASFTFVTLAPLRFSYCPYRTPVISIRRVLGKENFCQWISSIARVLRNAGRRLARGRRPQGEDIEMMAADNDSRAAVVPVVEQAREEPKSLVDSKHAKSGLEILKRVDAFFFDDDLLSAMRVCLTGSEFDLNTILEWIPEVVANRYGGRKPQTLDDRTLSSLAMDGLKPVVAIIVESMARDVGGRTPDDWAPFDIELPVSIRTALILVIRWVHLMPDCVSIFGGILNILLQLNADVTKDLVGNVLSRNWFVPRDSYFWITDAKTVKSIKYTIQNDLANEPIDGVLCAFLNLIFHTDPEVLRAEGVEVGGVVKSLMDRLPRSREGVTAQSLHEETLLTCKYICGQLKDMGQEFADLSTRLGDLVPGASAQNPGNSFEFSL